MSAGNENDPLAVLRDMTSTTVPRRSILQGAIVGAGLLTSCGVAHRAGSSGPGSTHTRHTTAGSSPATTGATPAGTPPPSAWKALAASLAGDLVLPGDPDYPEAKELFNPRWDSVKPIAVVEAASAHDVSLAIAFAHKYALNVRPKSGGHSYVGASDHTGSMMISVSRMSHVSYDAASGIATVGAGAKLYPVHAALAAHGRTIPTGTCPTVGAAGLTLGGGLGVASTAHGVTCDQLASAQIVTADGVVRTASPSVNPNLYWALRGGGGGSFGIVTQFHYHTQPATGFGFFLMTFPWAHAAAVVRGWSSRVQVMPHTTWANLHLEASTDRTADARVVGVCPPGQEQAQADAMQAAVGYDATSTSLFTKSFLDGIQFLGGGTTSQRQGWAAGSDVLTSMTTPVSESLVRVIAQRAASGHAGVAILDPLTGAVHAKTPAATAFPWRRHLCDIQWYLSLPDHPPAKQIQGAYDWIDKGHASVKALSAGGYVNYIEPRRDIASYYAGNFTRLRKVKAQYDPTNFFNTHWGIPG